LLAERLLMALAALGAPMEARPKMFQRAMGAIFEMILAESGRSSAAEQNEVSARIDKTIAALSPTEFPNLTEFRAALVAEAAQARAAKPSPEVAAHYADRPAHRNARRQIAARRRSNRDRESAGVASSPLIDRRTIQSCCKLKWPRRGAILDVFPRRSGLFRI
jgi:hypothetical protein